MEKAVNKSTKRLILL